MPHQTTRRGFLAGLLGLTVVAALPKVPGSAPALPEAIDPWAITAPSGTTYQWVRTALLGEPDPANLHKRLDNGWDFVLPEAHPGAPVSTVEHAIEASGLVLMQKSTAEVQAQLAEERVEHEARWNGGIKAMKPGSKELAEADAWERRYMGEERWAQHVALEKAKGYR